MKKIFVLVFLLTACTPSTPAKTQVVSSYATLAATPWLADLYACAEKSNVVINITAQSPDIFLQVGEPEALISPAYQIDEEEILVVTNRESSVQNLSLEEAQELFAGQGNASVQIWGYASEADVQIVFDQLVMKGRSVTSLARMAADPQQMSDVLNSEPNSVGILPKHWKAGNVREVYSAGVVPVLAITKQEPQGIVGELVSCLQK
ncbi:MAG: hypothetical protein U0V02_15175 [Anaerolineales bacterium]